MIIPFVSLPGRYARALFEIGEKRNILNELSDDFRKFVNLMLQDKNLFPCYVKRSDAKNLCETLGNVFNLNTVFVSFINVLVENGRLNMISKIADIFNKAMLRERNERNITVYSSSDLTSEQQNNIKETVQKLFSEKINVQYETDRDILTGFVIKTDGIMIDASGKEIVRQLNKYLKSTEIL